MISLALRFGLELHSNICTGSFSHIFGGWPLRIVVQEQEQRSYLDLGNKDGSIATSPPSEDDKRSLLLFVDEFDLGQAPVILR